jgi:LPPG:FO 2-phospho-L-lactate transferase
MVIDEKDENFSDSIGEIINKVIITNTIMNSSDVKINLAKKNFRRHLYLRR